MKAFYILFCSVFLSLGPSLTWASPATNVQLSYDMNKQVLHVQADHPTDRLERYFIQRVVVIGESQEVQNFYFSRQRSPAKFIEDLDYSAAPGDHLEVKLFCSQGGTTSGSLDIPQAQQNKDTHEKKTVSDRK